jgi:hypothetical protein
VPNFSSNLREFAMSRPAAKIVLLIWAVVLLPGCSVVDPMMARLTVLSGADVIPEEPRESVPQNHSDTSSPTKSTDANSGGFSN